jgi:hypothetical protein
MQTLNNWTRNLRPASQFNVRVNISAFLMSIFI